MANIMNLTKVSNKPSRNGFDLSQKINFTAKVGELMPIWWTPVLPTDSIRVQLNNFIRTQSLNQAAFARMRGYYDFYFVPFSQLWNKFNTAITQMTTNLQVASGPVMKDNKSLSGQLPYFTCEQVANYIVSLGQKKNTFGFYRSTMTCRLLEYLGYGDFYAYDPNGTAKKTWSTDPMKYNLALSPFPLLAYQKIYADYNRYTQWEKTNPSTFNLDYIKGTNDLQMDLSGLVSDDYNFFDMRYCNYQKDMFHGVLPVAQYGSASVVPVSGGLTISGNGIPTFFYNSVVKPVTNPNTPVLTNVDGATGSQAGALGIQGTGANGLLQWKDPKLVANADAASFAVSVLALRQAEFMQKWKEVSVSGDEDYKTQIQKHWNITVSEFLSHQARYLGGCATSLDINEVVNNNITGDNAADIAGKGTFTGNGSIRFESMGEYGIIMCIYHVLPIVDYVGSGVDHACTLTDATSFPIPELDQVGMESVPLVRAMNPLKSGAPSAETFLGYAPRYIDWKTAVDRSVGAFSGSLRTWCLPMGDAELTAADSLSFPTNANVESDSIQAGFFKVNPSIVDSLFAVKADSSVDTDEFLCSSYFDVKVVRNLDVNGLPY